jgi:cytosine/adenosine deaminase-related metal-dependent hydrolase
VLEEAGLLDRNINIVHGNELSDVQLKRFVEARVSFTVTTESEMVCGHGQPIIGRLRAAGARPSLGSDIESAFSADMLSAMRVSLTHQRAADYQSARAQGGVSGERGILTREALAWGTIEGARMLGQEDRLGSIRPGKQADLVLITADSLNMQPVHDPVSSVVMHANQSNIHSVMVAGRWVKRHGSLLFPDVQRVLGELCQSGCRILAELPARGDSGREQVRQKAVTA